MPESALVFCAPESEGLMSLEIRRLMPDGRLTWAADGLARIESDRPFEEVASKVAGGTGHGCIFARQIAPAQVVLPDDASLAEVCEAVQTVCARMPADARWNIHVRDSEKRAVETAAEAVAGADGRSRSDPELIVSVVHADAYYVGMAHAATTLSTWPGGERRFRKEEARISRSEFKLLEALEVFGLTLPQRGTALDLGAAPGGWTRILLEHGLDVTAADPGNLDARLKGHPRLRHVRATAERFLQEAPVFDLIVNDMRMSAEQSARIMASYAYKIKMDQDRQGTGVGIMTLKLPERGITSRATLELTYRCLDMLGGAFARIRARQLFHNRSEVTVVMEAPAACA